MVKLVSKISQLGSAEVTLDPRDLDPLSRDLSMRPVAFLS